MRTCSECGKKMNEGYCIQDGADYYCSDACLYKNIPQERYLDMYYNDDAYWTTWEEDDEDV